MADILVTPSGDAAVAKKRTRRIVGARDLTAEDYVGMLREDKRRKEETEKEKQRKKEERERKRKEREEAKMKKIEAGRDVEQEGVEQEEDVEQVEDVWVVNKRRENFLVLEMPGAKTKQFPMSQLKVTET